MSTSRSGCNANTANLLDQSWPDFLNLIDRDPDGAFEAFYAFATKLLSVCPPKPMRMVRDHDREDLVHDIILHCCRDDFRVIKRYRDRGKPFAAWFLLVARNKVLDFLRPRRRGTDVPLVEEGEETPGAPIPGTDAVADDQVDRRQILAMVRDALEGMSDACRILLQGAAEGCRPRELTRLLGWPDDWNKKASDALRECRKGLRKLLQKKGLDASELGEQFAD